MLLGIEIGGTKLQMAVGPLDGGSPVAWERREIDPAQGAPGILAQIESVGGALTQRFSVNRIGVGFGGPVDAARGRVRMSHQIQGWEDFPLGAWCQTTLGCPTVLGNDCDCAALAESQLGAGRGHRSVFFLTVGTGVGGGWVLDGTPHGGDRPAVAEIGHLRPGMHADRAEQTVESLASGWGIVAQTLARIRGECRMSDQLFRSGQPLDRAQVRMHLESEEQVDEEFIADLQARCDGDLNQLTAEQVLVAARQGNQVAADVVRHALQALGWAIAQVVTLLAPEVVVVGGGVSLAGETEFFLPLRRQVDRYVFPPLRGSFQVLPAELGERVVVHGALLMAASQTMAAE